MSRVSSFAVALRGGLCVYAASLAVITTLISFGSAAVFQYVIVVGSEFLLVEQSPRASAPKAPVRASVTTDVRGHVTLTQDWLDRIRSDDFWSGKSGARGGGGPSQPYVSRSNLFGPSRPEPLPRARFDDVPRFRERTETPYRTVCVRPCDGYFWPVSFATSEAHFQRDRAVCEKSCGQTAKLYVSRNSSGELDDMRDLDGQPYTRLPTAFRFRTAYEPTCKCNPHPWEQEAKDKHRLFAVQDQQRKSTKPPVQAKAQPNMQRLDETRGKTANDAPGKKTVAYGKLATGPAVNATGAEVTAAGSAAGAPTRDVSSPKFLIINAALIAKPQPQVRPGPSAARDLKGDRGAGSSRR